MVRRPVISAALRDATVVLGISERLRLTVGWDDSFIEWVQYWVNPAALRLRKQRKQRKQKGNAFFCSHSSMHRYLLQRTPLEVKLKYSYWRKTCFLLWFALVPVWSYAQDSAQSLKTLSPEQVKDGANQLSKENDSPVSRSVEELKQAALELNRDLLLLEEDLLFPANTQISVFVSVDVGYYFQLDAVKLTIDDDLVTSHVYTEKQNSALSRGGIQRLYLGNLKTGKHQITAYFHGYGPQNREYKRAATYTLNKDQNPTMLELRVRDSTRSMEPEFDFKEWHLQ